MGAKTKLNTAYLNGSLIGGGFIGLCFESMTAFVIATIFLIGCGYYNKDIRYRKSCMNNEKKTQKSL